ncbi:MAG: IS66 family insertion sequence element accessory protein TnpB [Proteocatella sp.]
MFNLTASDRFYLYPYPTDMRKSFYTLSGIVTNQMGKDVQDGDAFIFINMSATSMKILHMEYGGLVIYHMKLTSGQFSLPKIDLQEGEIVSHETLWSELVLMVQGIDAQNVKHRARWSPKTKNIDLISKKMSENSR